MFQRNSLARPVDNLITLMQGDDVEIEAAQRAANDVMRAAQGANTRQLSEAVQRLAALVPSLKIGRAAMLAITCGALVERGAEMQPIAGPALARFADAVRDGLPFLEACLAEAAANPLPPHHHHHHDGDDHDASADDADDEDEGGGSPAENSIVHYGGVVSERMPEVAQAFGSLEWLNTAALAMLSRSKALRAQLRADASLVATIRRWDALGLPLPCSHKMLSILDDEQVVVLHPALGRGYLIRIGGIGDNFQLHTLLAGALIGDEAKGWLPGKRPTPQVIALAKDAPITDLAKLPTAYGSFNLWNWTGIRADGMLPDLQSNQFDGGAHWIWNEGVPADIVPFEGTRVILLGPEPYPRSWNSGRFFPAMTGELTVVRQLSADETRDWLARLASAPKPTPAGQYISADDVANP